MRECRKFTVIDVVSTPLTEFAPAHHVSTLNATATALVSESVRACKRYERACLRSFLDKVGC